MPEVGVCQRLVCARGGCVRRGSLLQDHLPVKFNDPKLFFLEYGRLKNTGS